MLTEYQKAPAVTRDRLYIETMQQIYSNVTKVLVDSAQRLNLLYLPLDKLMQQAGAAGRGAPAPPPVARPSRRHRRAGAGRRALARRPRTRDREGR